jgi:hypothetical protein
MGRTSCGLNRQSVFAIVVVLFLTATVVAATPASSGAQDKHATATSEKTADKTVDKTKMGPYRALAHLAYASFQKGDNATAAELAQILERVWDKSEDYGGETALSKTKPDLFKKIDQAMDDFITPLTDYAKNPPDPARMKAAYTSYLEKLKLAD